METKNVLAALASLSQETRLSIYRLLVTHGPEGLTVGEIAESLGLANATLSFHLKELTHAGLVVAQPNGRSIRCSANFKAMQELVTYLTENCCAAASCDSTVDCGPRGTVCAPVSTSVATKKPAAKSRTTLRNKPTNIAKPNRKGAKE